MILDGIPKAADPQRRPDRWSARTGISTSAPGTVGRVRAGPGQVIAGRQDPADHPGRRAGAGQPVRQRGVQLRAPQRPGPGLRRAGPAVGLRVRQPEWDELNLIERGQQLRLAAGRGLRRGRRADQSQGGLENREASPVGPGLLAGRAVDGRAARRAALGDPGRRHRHRRAGRPTSRATTGGYARWWSSSDGQSLLMTGSNTDGRGDAARATTGCCRSADDQHVTGSVVAPSAAVRRPPNRRRAAHDRRPAPGSGSAWCSSRSVVWSVMLRRAGCRIDRLPPVPRRGGGVAVVALGLAALAG